MWPYQALALVSQNIGGNPDCIKTTVRLIREQLRVKWCWEASNTVDIVGEQQGHNTLSLSLSVGRLEQRYSSVPSYTDTGYKKECNNAHSYIIKL